MLAALVVGALALIPALIASPAYAAAGDFTQYTADGAQVRDVGVGPGGNPWFTDNAASEIGYVDVTTGTTTTYANTNSDYYAFTGITEGPDGNMWFIAVGFTGTYIVQFDVATHVFTQHAVPTGGAVSNIVSAAGKLWVTEGVGGSIAAYDPGADSWVEYGSLGGDPSGLTLAPNGILWYTNYNGHTVGWLDPSAATPVATIAAGQPVNGGSTSLTVASDGTVWVAENNNNRIDSYDPGTSTWTTGQSLGAAVNLDLFGVTTGSDGNIWYSLYGYDGVGVIDVATGTPTNYKIPSADGTQWSSGIVSGSDGNVWVGAYYGRNMYRVTLAHIATITTATLPGGKVNLSYSQTLAATGTGPITFAVTSGALPAGLALDPATGVISGTPTAIETASFTITATGADGSSDATFTIVIGASLAATGVDVTPSLLLSALMLLVGLGLMVVRRRQVLIQR